MDPCWNCAAEIRWQFQGVEAIVKGVDARAKSRSRRVFSRDWLAGSFIVGAIAVMLAVPIHYSPLHAFVPDRMVFWIGIALILVSILARPFGRPSAATPVTPKALSRRLLIGAALATALAGTFVELAVVGDRLIRPVYTVGAIVAALSALGFGAVAILGVRTKS